MEMKKNRIVILADGTFPKSEYPLSLLHNADIIICCDGAILKLLKYTSLNADYIVGDMDTLSQEYQIKYKEIIHEVSEQETNDQTKAFRFALTLNPSEIFILGATGDREDHTLGNLSWLVNYTEQFSNTSIITDHGVFTALSDSCSISCSPKQQVSIFAFDPTLKIKSAGLKYPTDNVTFDLWWKATLNETCSTSFSLEFSHPAKVLLFLCTKAR